MSDELAARNALILYVATLVAAYEAPALSAQQTQIKDDLPDRYVEVGVSRRFGGSPRRAGSPSEIVSYRATTRYVAKTEDDALRLAKACAGLEGAILTVGAGTTGGVDYETSSRVGPDEGWFSGYTDWTFSV